MTQPPKQEQNPTADHHEVRQGRNRKLKIIAATALLIIGTPVALFVAATFGLTGHAARLVGPSVSSKDNITRPKAPKPSIKNRAALQTAISKFERAEKLRSQNFKRSLASVKKIELIAQKSLRKESALVAGRIVNSSFGIKFYLAKMTSSMSLRLGANPDAVDQLVKRAVGNESAKILNRADQRLAAELKVIGARGTPIMSQKSQQQAALLNPRLSRQIIRRAPEALGAVAKKYGVRVAGRTAAKSPVVALDGPVPVADAALFFSTVVDFYKQGGAARRDLTHIIRGVVFTENRSVLAKRTAATTKTIKKRNQLKRQRNCDALRSAYNLNPVSDMKATVDKRCRA